MSAPTWSDLAVADLDVALLHDVLALRAEVFVVEQACAYLDVDGADLAPGTRHLVARDDEGLAAYARLLAPDADHAAPRIGRVVVAPRLRGARLGRALMTRALEACAQHWPGEPVELGGQAHLVGFYRSLGFVPVGEEYVEDGIPHRWMRRDGAVGPVLRDGS
ncbi:MAG: GCN5-related N-acetyltransferase [Marmoricola sp.]|nr:GCN5-related N-acetyltransferase [Marmoricola sp.]